MKESEILKATLHFARTGGIADELIRYFDQNGRWIGDRRNWRHTIHAAARIRMRHAFLAPHRRTQRSRAGLHLLTSFVWRDPKPARINYCDVAGSVRIPNNVSIDAPQLRTIGGHFHTQTRAAIHLPDLRQVGGDFDAPHTRRVHAPRLKDVGGKLQVQEFALPALETVGGRLEMLWTLHANAPRLRDVGGSLHAHTASVFEAQGFS